jgi:hypothetical protein
LYKQKKLELEKTSKQNIRGTDMTKRLLDGALAGLAGGLAFGVLMGVMGMFPMVAKLIGSESALAGFALHMILSAVIGGGFGVVFGAMIYCFGTGVGYGLVYGLAWWILGPLTLMPTLLGMGPQLTLEAVRMTLPSLGGHILYGILTGLAYTLLAHRARVYSASTAA